MWLKVVSWTSIVLNSLWVLFVIVAVVPQLKHLTPSGGSAAFVVGFWIGIALVGLVIVGAPILSIFTVATWLGRRAPSGRPVDAMFE
jgi:hypothetical protein